MKEGDSLSEITMTLAGISCRELGLHCKTHRPVLPELSESLLEVSGRHGSYDYNNNTYRDRMVTVDFFIKRNDFPNFRLGLRKVAAWLRRKGEIRFSDEPDKYYIGRCYQAPDLEQIVTPTGLFSAVFICEPFAYGQTITQSQTGAIPVTVPISYPGSFQACTTIIVRNTGTMPIHGIRIRHNMETD